MTGFKNWAIRPYIKDFRQPDEKYPKGVEARYVILDYLILCSNLRLRNFYGVETIMEECGFNSSAVVADALGWLFDRGALYNVPPEYRVGKEAKLSKNKYVFQMTGVIYLRGQWIPYLLLQPDELEEMVEEWRTVGYQLPVEGEILLSGYKTSQSEPSQSEPSQSEREGISLVLEGIPPSSEVTSGAGAPTGRIAEESIQQRQIRLGLEAANKAKSLSDQSPKQTPKTDGELFVHPMVTTIAEAAGRNLNQSEFKKLQATVPVTDDDGIVTQRPSRLWMYDNVPGFSDFFLVRVNVQKNLKSSKFNIMNLIADMGNERREGTGWLAWKDKNKHLTTRNSDGTKATKENHDVEFIDTD